jgi:hypothetical protein
VTDDIVETIGKKEPKDKKGSARGKYNRRKRSAAHALEQLKISAQEVLEQDGTIYKRKEIETLLAEIDRFVAATGLKVDYEKMMRELGLPPAPVKNDGE